MEGEKIVKARSLQTKQGQECLITSHPRAVLPVAVNTSPCTQQGPRRQNWNSTAACPTIMIQIESEAESS